MPRTIRQAGAPVSRRWLNQRQAGPVGAWAQSALHQLLGVQDLVRLRDAAEGMTDPFELVEFALRGMRITIDVCAQALGQFPESGPLVIVANHAFGALDGLGAIHCVGRRRRDLKVLANPELQALDSLAPLLLPLDPYGNAAMVGSNATSLRAAVRWLRSGHALLVFPAGEVAHFAMRTGSVTDPAWSTTAARLIALSNAAAVPMYFAGSNSALFHLAGLMHPSLRSLLLPRELASRAGTVVSVRVGDPLEPASCREFASEQALTAHLRVKTYLLGAGVHSSETQLAGPHSRPPPENLRAPIEPRQLAAEIAALPEQNLLVTSGAQRVYCAASDRIPQTLAEIGRLRELTFRAVGEGTGCSTDLDVFDTHYEHLFIWHETKQEIVGAYRLGRIDRIRARYGTKGLYTSTLFDYREPFLTLLGPTLELGRSFVRPEYQRSFAALMLLWKGIGEYIRRNPRYVRLIGPVSISDDYSAVSRAVLVRYLRMRNFDHFGAAFVRARNPFPERASLRSLTGELGLLCDIEALSALVADLEPDGKGVPILLRQYLKLGGRMLGFNIDASFANALDCLIMIDLRRTDPAVLRKYLPNATLERLTRRFGSLAGKARRAS